MTYVKIRIRGFPTQSATFERKTDAKNWASDTETAMRAGRYFKTSKSKKHTLGEMIDRYKNDYLKRHPKREADILQKLEWWKKQFGYKTLADISKSVIIEQRDKLANTPKKNGEDRKPATVNRFMTALSVPFGWEAAMYVQPCGKDCRAVYWRFLTPSHHGNLHFLPLVTLA